MSDPPQVTIVDDDPSVRKALGRLCKTAGYSVKLYDSGESFSDAEINAETDFLILDVNLPGKSGLELQAELAAAGTHCPILFITAYEDESARRRAIEGGAIDFLGKPLDVDRLLDLIGEVLSGE